MPIWTRIIVDSPLSCQNCICKVIMLTTEGSGHLYLSQFENKALEEKKNFIKNISYTDAIKMLTEFGIDKKCPDESLKVFEFAQDFVKNKQDIPSELLCMVIKKILLIKRDSFISQKKEELDSLLNVDAQPQQSRQESLEEEVKQDDIPLNGPDLYFTLSEFKNSRLLPDLIKIGVPISALVKIFNPVVAEVTPTKKNANNKISKIDMHDITSSFWDDIQGFRNDPEYFELFKNTAFLIFRPNCQDAVEILHNSDEIYDELCNLIYDVQDLSQQHEHYLDNIDVVHIPKNDKIDLYYTYYSQLIDHWPIECVTIYSVIDSLMQVASQENMASVVSTSTSPSPDDSRPPPPQSSAVHGVDSSQNPVFSKKQCTILPDLKDYKPPPVKLKPINTFASLCTSEANRKIFSMMKKEAYENHVDPVVITYGDFVKTQVFHLQDTHLDDVVGSILFGMPLHNLWLIQKTVSEDTEAKINFHVNVLLSCFERDDVETSDIVRLLHILSCKTLYNSKMCSLKSSIHSSLAPKDTSIKYLKRTNAEPYKCLSCFATTSLCFSKINKINYSLDQSLEERQETCSETQRLMSQFECPGISELVSITEKANNHPVNHMIDDFEFFEDFSGTCAYQILLDAFNKFNKIDYKFCEVTDSIVMMFYNTHDKNNIYSKNWDRSLCVPVCMHDFVEFILEEQNDWIQSEAEKYNSIPSNDQSHESVNSCPKIPSFFNDIMGVLKSGLIKNQEKVKVEEMSSIDTTPDIKSNESSHSDANQNGPQTDTSKVSTADPSNHEEPKPAKPFVGYDLGDQRIEVLGRDTVYFSRDRTQITTFYTNIKRYDVEHVALRVAPGDKDNEFWVHRIMGSCISPEILNKCESFRVNTKDNLMINMKKQFYTDTIIPSDTSVLKLPKGQRLVIDTTPVITTRHFYSFCITWPNGHITESVHDDDSFKISHIKQFHSSPCGQLNEDMRCISLNGEVIIFKSLGDIRVLCPSGTVLIITKCGKIEIPPPKKENIEIILEDQKNLKNEKKDKNKEKVKKDQVVFAEEKDVPVQPLEYELYIDEYEAIDNSGLKEKWIKEEPQYFERIKIKTAVDYYLGEIFSKRSDGTIDFHNKNGEHIVTFPDKTRIITRFIVEEDMVFPEWTAEEEEIFNTMNDLRQPETKPANFKEIKHPESVVSTDSSKLVEEEIRDETKSYNDNCDGYISVQLVYTIEHPNFTTVTINKSIGDITVDCPNSTSLTVDEYNRYEVSLNGNTSFNFDGDDLKILYEACPECKSYTTCDIKITKNDEDEGVDIEANGIWAKLKDSFCKKIAVDEKGNIQLVNAHCSEDRDTNVVDAEDNQQDWKSETSVISHGKCQEMYQAKNFRFIIMNRNLSCSELVHRALLEQYKDTYKWQPWCFMNKYDTFGDRRTIHTILTSLEMTETEKWIMNSKISSNPTNLTFKDLKDFDNFYNEWGKPRRKHSPPSIQAEPVAHKLPKANVLRTLEQQWPEDERDQWKGAKELVNAILRYLQRIQSFRDQLLRNPLVDKRTDEERAIDSAVQEVAARLYEDLKNRPEENVALRASIVNKKCPAPYEAPCEIEEEIEEGPKDPLQLLNEERMARLQELESVFPSSKKVKMCHEAREQSIRDEKFCVYLLRDDKLPAYFQNIIGGSEWCELDNMADDAILATSQKKMNCICSVDPGEVTTETSSGNACYTPDWQCHCSCNSDCSD